MRRFLKGVRLPAFFLGLVIAMSAVLGRFTVSDKRIFQTVEALYEEDCPLDAVYVGSSSTYTFWQAPLGWEKFGFAIHAYAIPSVSAPMLKYMIAEARKTQPDALYIINLSTFNITDVGVTRLHYLADFMRLSRNKIDMIRDLGARSGITGADLAEFYLPFIRFHSGWSELASADFVLESEQMKGAVHFSRFLRRSTDLTAHYQETAECVPLSDSQQAALDELLGYIREENINVLFVLVPQTGKDTTVLGQYNTLAQAVGEAGFPVLNLTRSMGELGINVTNDYYNDGHTNIHGCVKYMNYLGAYLREHYGFEDKRGDPAYSSWDEAVERYKEYSLPYTLDFERDASGRDFSLPKPVLTGAAAEDGTVSLSWTAENSQADGCVIYRKSGKATGTGIWTRLAEVGGGSGSYIDADTAAGKNYTYTAVPVRYEGEAALYGDFDYAGINVTTEAVDKAA